jgi:hypothetical protein
VESLEVAFDFAAVFFEDEHARRQGAGKGR